MKYVNRTAHNSTSLAAASTRLADAKRFYKCILVKSGPKRARTDRKNISVESAHWLSAERAMTSAQLANRFDTRNVIGWSNYRLKFGLPVVEIGFVF